MRLKLLCGTALAVLMTAAAPAAAQTTFPQASGAWGQLPGNTNSPGDASAHAIQANNAVRALRGKTAPLEGTSSTTAGVINSITTNINNQGNNNALEVINSDNTQRGTNSGTVQSTTAFVQRSGTTNLGNQRIQ
jgi:hypothetical protein